MFLVRFGNIIGNLFDERNNLKLHHGNIPIYMEVTVRRRIGLGRFVCLIFILNGNSSHLECFYFRCGYGYESQAMVTMTTTFRYMHTLPFLDLNFSL